MNNLNKATAHELSAQMSAGQVSSLEITEAVLDAIETGDDVINAYISVDAESALEQARAVDARRAAGERLGVLGGVPVAIKDVLCVKGGRTTCGSKILSNFVAPYDATAVAKLRNADAVLIGKTNMDEFAMGSSTENSHFGPTRNPRDTSRVPGGSSGGSAAAVAAHETILSLGSDTGGSVRQPAGYCGVVGMKPTYGRVSRFGLVAYASSLDQVGPIAKDVQDAALLLNVVAGHDRRDATSVQIPVVDYCQGLEDGVVGLKVGLAREHFGPGLDPEIHSATMAAAENLRQQGAEIVELDLPIAGNSEYCIGTYYLIAMGEASANLTRYDGVKYGHRADDSGSLEKMYLQTRSEGFGAEVKRRIMLGTYALSAGYYNAYYLKAQKVRTLIKNDFERAFETVEVLLAPVAPTVAFPLGQNVDDPLQMYLNDIYTVSVNLAGIPGITIPYTANSEGLPIGIQLLGAPFQEQLLFRTGKALEQMADWCV